jgi:hypothetical protein
MISQDHSSVGTILELSKHVHAFRKQEREIHGLFQKFQNFLNNMPTRCLSSVGEVVLCSGVLPIYRPFCRVVLV